MRRVLSNYHSHSKYCDGKGEIEEYIKKAIECGFKYLGVSSHSPHPYSFHWSMNRDDFSSYVDEINTLHEKYRDKIEILAGLEIDYVEGVSNPKQDEYKDLDYTLGSVHYMGKLESGRLWSADSRYEVFMEGVNQCFEGDIQKAVKEFYKRNSDMAENYPPDIIGHFDLIKINNKNNRLFDEKSEWYRETVLECIRKISKTSCIIEVNTGGIVRDYIDSVYPSEWILKECFKLGIDITITSDCHRPQHMDGYFEEAAEIVKKCGYEEITIITRNGREKFKL